MTLYGDLDVSVIDELPAGRKPIQTVHRYDSDRLRVFEFLRSEIAKKRQVYIVYPLIEESEQMDFKNLMDGYESISRAFPTCALSIVHGKMKAAEKDYEMQRFKKGETEIMVATTVIEVGVDVPNASVMVIENAERFGLSQLHQLRGRVGRGRERAYAYFLYPADQPLSELAHDRLTTIAANTELGSGMRVALKDLEIRGAGNLLGGGQFGLPGHGFPGIRHAPLGLIRAIEAAADRFHLRSGGPAARPTCRHCPLFGRPASETHDRKVGHHLIRPGHSEGRSLIHELIADRQCS